MKRKKPEENPNNRQQQQQQQNYDQQQRSSKRSRIASPDDDEDQVLTKLYLQQVLPQQQQQHVMMPQRAPLPMNNDVLDLSIDDYLKSDVDVLDLPQLLQSSAVSLDSNTGDVFQYLFGNDDIPEQQRTFVANARPISNSTVATASGTSVGQHAQMHRTIVLPTGSVNLHHQPQATQFTTTAAIPTGLVINAPPQSLPPQPPTSSSVRQVSTPSPKASKTTKNERKPAATRKPRASKSKKNAVSAFGEISDSSPVPEIASAFDQLSKTAKFRIMSNAKSELMYVSQAMRDKLGYTEEELKQSITYPMLFHPDGFQRTLDFHLKSMLTQKLYGVIDNLEFIKKGFAADDPAGKFISKKTIIKYSYSDQTNGFIADDAIFDC